MGRYHPSVVVVVVVDGIYNGISCGLADSGGIESCQSSEDRHSGRYLVMCKQTFIFSYSYKIYTHLGYTVTIMYTTRLLFSIVYTSRLLFAIMYTTRLLFTIMYTTRLLFTVMYITIYIYIGYCLQ